jgi:hypothetical protein
LSAGAVRRGAGGVAQPNRSMSDRPGLDMTVHLPVPRCPVLDAGLMPRRDSAQTRIHFPHADSPDGCGSGYATHGVWLPLTAATRRRTRHTLVARYKMCRSYVPSSSAPSPGS